MAGGTGVLPNNRPIRPTDGRQVNQFDIDIDDTGAAASGADFRFAPRAQTLDPVKHA